MLVVSLVAQAALLLLGRAFDAGGKTLIPLVTAVVSASVTIGFALWLAATFAASPTLQASLASFFRLEAVAGAEVIILAAAFAAGQLLHIVLLLSLTARTYNINYASIGPLFLQALMAAAAGASAAYITLSAVVAGINQDTFLGVFLQGAIAGLAGLAATILVYHLFGSQELYEIRKSFRARLFKTDVVEPEAGVL